MCILIQHTQSLSSNWKRRKHRRITLHKTFLIYKVKSKLWNFFRWSEVFGKNVEELVTDFFSNRWNKEFSFRWHVIRYNHLQLYLKWFLFRRIEIAKCVNEIQCKQQYYLQGMHRIRMQTRRKHPRQTRRYAFNTNRKKYIVQRVHRSGPLVQFVQLTRFLTSARIFLIECVSYILQLHLYLWICKMFVSIFLVFHNLVPLACWDLCLDSISMKIPFQQK